MARPPAALTFAARSDATASFTFKVRGACDEIIIPAGLKRHVSGTKSVILIMIAVY
jgi:hypothetical protein